MLNLKGALCAAFLLAATSANAGTVSCHEFDRTVYCDDGTEAHTFFGDTHINRR